jgi:hypothetical protein
MKMNSGDKFNRVMAFAITGSCFATTRWSVVTLDPGKRQMNILLLVDTTIEGASPSHARQE